MKIASRKRTWRDLGIKGILLMGLWLLLSGHYDLFHISLGLLSSVLVLSFNARIDRVQFFQRDIAEWERIRYGRLLRYIPWLLLEIILSGLQVAYVVLSPRMPLDPSLVRFRARMPHLGASVILGNSITLTPGTLTIEIEGDEFLVHALLDESARGLADGTMATEVARLFRGRVGDVVTDVRIQKSIKEV